MAFKDRLKEARLNNGLTQEQVAERIGVAKSTFTGYEKGNSEPNMYTISQIMNVLKVDANFLWQDEMDALGGNPAQLKYNEMKHIEKYRNLDDPGRRHVDTVLQWETDRMEQLSQTEVQISELKSRPVTLVDFYTLKPAASRITEYFRSASAGDGVFILGNESKAKIAVSESDWNAQTDYVIAVSGDSMNPDFMDGDNVMVSQHVPVKYGDVGIFIVNGNVYIKEYGETELISRNPDFPNIKVSEFDNIVCMGKVLGKLKGDYKIINE